MLTFLLTQHYNCVMIPGSIDIGGLWNVLPPGIHNATLQEIENGFATNEARTGLFEGLNRGVEVLVDAGCRTIFLDGSFVSDKPYPGDFDVCWDPTGVSPARLDPVLLDFSQARRRQKSKYGGEFFPSSTQADGSQTFLDYFQIDKDTGRKKGIIRIQLPSRTKEEMSNGH